MMVHILVRRTSHPSVLLASAMLAAAMLAAAMLASCTVGSGSATVTAAARATDTACAAALTTLPSSVLGKGRTPLDVAGAAAWGEPAIMLRCGLPEQAPTTEACLTIDGVDWVVNDGADPIVFISYGRSPAVEVRVPTWYGRENASAALVDVAAVAKALPATARHCIGG